MNSKETFGRRRKKDEGRRTDRKEGRKTTTNNKDEVVYRNAVVPSSDTEGVRIDLAEHAQL